MSTFLADGTLGVMRHDAMASMACIGLWGDAILLQHLFEVFHIIHRSSPSPDSIAMVAMVVSIAYAAIFHGTESIIRLCFMTGVAWFCLRYLVSYELEIRVRGGYLDTKRRAALIPPWTECVCAWIVRGVCLPCEYGTYACIRCQHCTVSSGFAALLVVDLLFPCFARETVIC